MPSPFPLGIYLYCACNGLSLQIPVTFYLRTFCSHGDAQPAHEAVWRCWGGDASRSSSQPMTNGSLWIKPTVSLSLRCNNSQVGSVVSSRAPQWDWTSVAFTSNLLINTSCIDFHSFLIVLLKFPGITSHINDSTLKSYCQSLLLWKPKVRYLVCKSMPICNKSMEKWKGHNI